MEEKVKWTEVVCAIIESGNKILCVQRSQKMKLPHKWELPGGKLIPGESEKKALKREIKEELNIDILVLKRLIPNNHIYPNGVSIKLIPFHCQIMKGEFELLEHAEYKWLEPNELSELDWAEADIPIIKQIEHLKL
jgi:8-oxo-dGTP diphosphatase